MYHSLYNLLSLHCKSVKNKQIVCNFNKENVGIT